MRRVWNKTQDQIALEWDSITELRSQQIRSGKDNSYDNILTPTVLALVENGDRSAVLDVGCGCGFLTGKIAATSKNVTGIDISPTSIRLAKEHCLGIGNIGFVNGAIEELMPSVAGYVFTLAVTNMSLMAILNLDAALATRSRLVCPGCHLSLMITRLCFCPQYWNYSRNWFRYSEENVIEAPFHISLDQSDQFTTTHIHRPLEQYVSALEKSNFGIVRVLEPMPSPEVERLYPHPWGYPRFMGALCVRKG